MIGFFEFNMSSTHFTKSLLLAPGRVWIAGSNKFMSDTSANVSGGISISTGLGLPVLSSANALCLRYTFWI